jgi:hypothetical protein
MDDRRSVKSATSGHRRVVGQGIGWQMSGDIWRDDVVGVLFGWSECSNMDKRNYRLGTGQRMIGNQ